MKKLVLLLLAVLILGLGSPVKADRVSCTASGQCGNADNQAPGSNGKKYYIPPPGCNWDCAVANAGGQRIFNPSGGGGGGGSAPAQVCSPNSWSSSLCATCKSDGSGYNSSCGNYGPTPPSPGNTWCGCMQKCQSAAYPAKLECQPAPIGYLDNTSCQGIWGWACDPKSPTTSISVDLYQDSPPGPGKTPFKRVTANVPRGDEAALDKACGGAGGVHGFYLPLSQFPSSLNDGKTHAIYAYAINTNPAGPNPMLPVDAAPSDNLPPGTMPVCDSTPPAITVSWPNTSSCYTASYFASNLIEPVKAHISDPSPSSGVNPSTLGFKIIDSFSNLVYDYGVSNPNLRKTANGDGSYDISEDLSKTATGGQVSLSNTTGSNKYRVTAYGKDNAGNPIPSRQSASDVSAAVPAGGFNYGTCTTPHLQTQNGDVHSQRNIGN